MNNSKIYLDSYLLQQDMRIRLPKSVLLNLDVTKGITVFDIYLDLNEKSIVMKIHEDEGENNG